MDGEVGNTIAVLVDFDDGCVVGGSGLVVLIPADLTGRVSEGSAHGRSRLKGRGRGAGVGVDRGEVEPVLAWMKSVMMSAAGPMPEFCKRGEAESVVASSPGHGVLPQPSDERVVAGIADQRVVAAKPGQHVVAGIAGEDVGAVGADAVDEGREGQRQVLDAGVGPEVPVMVEVMVPIRRYR